MHSGRLTTTKTRERTLHQSPPLPIPSANNRRTADWAGCRDSYQALIIRVAPDESQNLNTLPYPLPLAFRRLSDTIHFLVELRRRTVEQNLIEQFISETPYQILKNFDKLNKTFLNLKWLFYHDNLHTQGMKHCNSIFILAMFSSVVHSKNIALFTQS